MKIKLLATLVTTFLMTSLILESKVNEFGISDILIASDNNADKRNALSTERITEELGTNFTIQDILNFFPKIHTYYQYLLNNQIDNDQAWQMLILAVADIKHAKKLDFIRPNTVTPEQESQMRAELGKLNRIVRPTR